MSLDFFGCLCQLNLVDESSGNHLYFYGSCDIIGTLEICDLEFHVYILGSLGGFYCSGIFVLVNSIWSIKRHLNLFLWKFWHLGSLWGLIVYQSMLYTILNNWCFSMLWPCILALLGQVFPSHKNDIYQFLYLHWVAHGDVKLGNFIFSWKLNKGYLIDFNPASAAILLWIFKAIISLN